MLSVLLVRFTNYLRLLVQFGSGVIALPLVTASIGTQGWAYVSLLVAGIGIAGLVQDFIRLAVFRGLAAADGVNNDDIFRAAWRSTVGLTVAVGISAGCIFELLSLSIDHSAILGTASQSRAAVIRSLQQRTS